MDLLETPETSRKHVKIVEAGAKEAGRSIKDVDCGLTVPTVIREDFDEAFEIFAPVKHFLLILPKKLREAGYDTPSEYSPNYYLDELRVTRKDQEKFERIGEYVTEDMTRSFTLIGTVDDCIEKIERYKKAGLNHLIPINIDPDVDRTLDHYERDIIPYFRGE